MTIDPKKKRMVLVGAGGHARVVADVIRAGGNYDIIGATSREQEGDAVGWINIIGDDTVLPDIYESGVRHAFIAIGDNRTRKALTQNISSMGFTLISIISHNAYIASSVAVGAGTIVMPGAVIQPGVQLGEGVVVNTGTTVDHESVMGDFCHAAPGCNMAGNVIVGEGTFLGVGTKVIDNVTIGCWSIIGAGAVVVGDIPDSCLSLGVPAKIHRTL